MNCAFNCSSSQRRQSALLAVCLLSLAFKETAGVKWKFRMIEDDSWINDKMMEEASSVFPSVDEHLKQKNWEENHGVVYGTAGIKYLHRAVLSAIPLVTKDVAFYVGSRSELDMCQSVRARIHNAIHSRTTTNFSDLLQEAMQLHGRYLNVSNWKCIDATATPFFRALVDTGHGAPCSNSSKQDMKSRLIKLTAIADTPFKTTLFLDSDTRPCRNFHVLSSFFTSDSAEPDLLDVYDLMIAISRHAIKYDTQNDLRPPNRPPAFAMLNSGVIAYRANRPGVVRLWRRWIIHHCLYLNKNQMTFRNDQPDLMSVLYPDVAAGRIRLYVAGPQWNMKKWRDDYFTTIGSTCCPKQGHAALEPIVIDHGCELNSHDLSLFNMLESKENTASH